MIDLEETIPFGEDWQLPSSTLNRQERLAMRLPPTPLKQQPQHGVFLWWPSNADLWAHPDDVETVRSFVPGSRVFCRDVCKDYSDRTLGFVAYHYGAVCFRAKPILWLEVKPEGYQPGDRVEIKSRSGKTRARIGTISETLWDRHRRQIEYAVSSRGMTLPRRYLFDDLRPAIPLGSYLPAKHLDLARRGARVR